MSACALTQEHVFAAIDDARNDFALGAVGAGTGMSCFEMKGGIGSASRIIHIDQKPYTIGALVLSNFGKKQDFLGSSFDFSSFPGETAEQGSIIMIIATDIPMDARQLKRVCRRTPAALARLGSWLGNGSGDIAIAFSTGNTIRHFDSHAFMTVQTLHEDRIDLVFRAAIEACEEAVLSSLQHAETTVGHNGHIRYSLADTLKQMKKTKS